MQSPSRLIFVQMPTLLELVGILAEAHQTQAAAASVSPEEMKIWCYTQLISNKPSQKKPDPNVSPSKKSFSSHLSCLFWKQFNKFCCAFSTVHLFTSVIILSLLLPPAHYLNRSFGQCVIKMGYAVISGNLPQSWRILIYYKAGSSAG